MEVNSKASLIVLKSMDKASCKPNSKHELQKVGRALGSLGCANMSQ